MYGHLIDTAFLAQHYTPWTSVHTTLHLFQTMITSLSGMLNGLAGEEMLLWLNLNFDLLAIKQRVAHVPAQPTSIDDDDDGILVAIPAGKWASAQSGPGIRRPIRAEHSTDA